MNKLKQFESLIIQHNKKINLISRQSTDIWNRHIMNSLLIAPYLQKDERILDIGTGAGFPGMVLAIDGFHNITLVESKKKKCDFLHVAAETLKVQVQILNHDINTLFIETDVITSRALASISKLIHMTKNINFTKMILLKGKNLPHEIAEAKAKYQFEYEVYPDNIIKIYNIKY